MQYQPHELSLAFPEMAPDQYRRLLESVRQHGLIHPIVLLEGKILDGRHRYRACLEASIAPAFREYDGADPVSYVTAENAARRHLTESQLAHAVAAMKPYEERKARERQAMTQIKDGRAPVAADGRQPESGAGRTAEVLAKKAGVGARTVSRAIKVREHGTPELNSAVANGEIALTTAEKLVELNPSAQKRIVESPKERRAEVIREAMNRSDSSKRRNARETGKISVVKEPSTPFVRKFLSGIERVAMVCAEDGAKDGPAIATRFLNEMDWSATALTVQLERCEPILRALAIIKQRPAKAA